MAHAFYMDHSVHGAIVRGLRRRGVDVLTAQEDDYHAMPDPSIIDRATELGRIAFSQDRDFLRDGTRRQREGVPFYGVIYARQDGPIGTYIEDLHVISELEGLENLHGIVRYLPM